MAAIVGFVFSYPGLLSSAAVAALWLGLRPASRSGRRFLIVVAAAYALASLYVLPPTA